MGAEPTPHANLNCKTGAQAAGLGRHTDARAVWHASQTRSMAFHWQSSQDSVHLCRHGLWNGCQNTVGAQYVFSFVFCIATLTPHGPRVSLG